MVTCAALCQNIGQGSDVAVKLQAQGVALVTGVVLDAFAAHHAQTQVIAAVHQVHQRYGAGHIGFIEDAQTVVGLDGALQADVLAAACLVALAN